MPTRQALNRFASQVLEVMPFMVREFAKREDNDLTRGKISCPQMVALHQAAEHGEVAVGDIARILSINKSSASVLLDRMVRQKLMSRRHDRKDRRVVRVAITPQGRKVVSQIMGQKRRSIKAIFAPLTPRERRQYLSVLLKVKSHLISSCALLLLCAGLLQSPDAHPAPEENRPLLLHDAFQRALKHSESVAISAEEMSQAQARFYRAFDYFLPSVHFEMTRFYQDVDPDDRGSSGFGNSQRPNTPEKKFVFSQPLFSGFREIAALQGSGADKKQQRLAWQRAKELLFVDVMEAFYTVLEAQRDLEVLITIHELLSKRLKELDERVQLGRSRDSELKVAQAGLKILDSEKVTAKRRVRAALNLLEFYLNEPLDGRVLQGEEAPEDYAADRASSSARRADVASDEQGYIVAQKKVISANADLFPTITLDGNYYTQRVGFQDGNDWDMTLKFDVPVFEVGQTLGDIKEAASNREKARLKFSQTKRLAELDIRDAEEDLRSSRESEKALYEAYVAFKENYDILTEEYRLSLVNNLEVLDALEKYQEIERRYRSAYFTALKNFWKLRVAVGDVPGVNQ